MSPVAVLVGAPGAGKSTIGRRVARALQVPFADTDALIEERAGMPVSDIFLNEGEPAFRRMEEEVVASAIAERAGVVSLGGGAVLSEQTRAVLRGHPVVWLRVDLASAARRVGMNTARPLLLGNVRAQMSALLDARTPFYEEVSSIIVDTGNRPIRDVVADVLDGLGVAPAGTEREETP